MEFDLSTLPVGVLAIVVFFSRVVDVSIGTIRTISTVQGRMVLAFVLGLFEVTIWLVVIATLVNTVLERPWLLIFYALGFSTGNVVGIKLERKLALGHGILRIFTSTHTDEIIQLLRDADYRVTCFEGEGLRGPVSELHIVCERRRINRALALVQKVAPDVFFVCETPTRVRRHNADFSGASVGWIGALKRK